MSDSKFVDKRLEPQPERKKPNIVIYPRCPTCKHFETFQSGAGPGATVCVMEPPKVYAQIRGEDDKGNVVWATWNGYPVVTATTRCSKHAAAESN